MSDRPLVFFKLSRFSVIAIKTADTLNIYHRINVRTNFYLEMIIMHVQDKIE